MPTPPYTATPRMRVPFARGRRKVSVWAASSRVGERTRARVFPAVSFMRRWRIGRRKAAVLPEPVWVVPMTSRPPRMAGIASRWIGVGAS